MAPEQCERGGPRVPATGGGGASGEANQRTPARGHGSHGPGTPLATSAGGRAVDRRRDRRRAPRARRRVILGALPSVGPGGHLPAAAPAATTSDGDTWTGACGRIRKDRAGTACSSIAGAASSGPGASGTSAQGQILPEDPTSRAPARRRARHEEGVTGWLRNNRLAPEAAIASHSRLTTSAPLALCASGRSSMVRRFGGSTVRRFRVLRLAPHPSRSHASRSLPSAPLLSVHASPLTPHVRYPSTVSSSV